jgi:hypothetical protein
MKPKKPKKNRWIIMRDDEMEMMFNKNLAIPHGWYPGIMTMVVTRMFPEQWIMFYYMWRDGRFPCEAELYGRARRPVLRRIENAFDDFGIRWKTAKSRSRYNISMSEYRYVHRARFIPPGIKILMRFPENDRQF